MKTLAVLIVLPLLLSSCVIPNWYGPDFSKSPTSGMTMAEVRTMWGPPDATAYQDFGNVRYHVWTYEERITTVMPGWGGARPYDYDRYHYYTVTFRDGQVVGVSR